MAAESLSDSPFINRGIPWLCQLQFFTTENDRNCRGWRAILSPRSLALARLRMTRTEPG
jgi:hypothetical protein